MPLCIAPDLTSRWLKPPVAVRSISSQPFSAKARMSSGSRCTAVVEILPSLVRVTAIDLVLAVHLHVLVEDVVDCRGHQLDGARSGLEYALDVARLPVPRQHLALVADDRGEWTGLCPGQSWSFT